jgi:hypothetical protein
MGEEDKRFLPGDSIMITVTIFRSIVDDLKETKRLENPIKINDVFPGDDLSNSIISVNGFLQNSEYELIDGDICTIRVFPEGSGADWLTGLGIGLMLAVTVLNFWNPGGWATAAILAGGMAAGALGFGIASAAGWSVTAWLGSLGMNGQDMKSPDALEGIPQLRGAKNQSNYGKPVPIVLGKHLFTPMFVGNPYSTIGGLDGEYQYFHALYLLGYGKLKVSDVKLGIIGDLATNNANVQDGFLTFDGDPFLGKPNDPGDPDNPTLELVQTARESQLYPQAVAEEPLNIELSHPEGADPLNVVRFTAKNPMKVQIEITFPSGLAKYNDEGEKENASVTISIRWRVSRPDNSDYWKSFGSFGVDQAGISYNGLETIIYRSKTKVMRFVAEHIFTSYSEVHDNFDTRVIELEIKRTDTQSNSAKVIDKVYLTAVRTWLFDNEKSKTGELAPQAPVIHKLRDRTARLGFRIKATQNTQGFLDALNCVLESRCRKWNRITKMWSDSDWNIENQLFLANTEIPSNNPAAVALRLLQSPSLGRKAYKDSAIDMDSFGEFYEWCDDRNYTCNGVLTVSKRLDEVLALILSTGRAMRILNGNKYGLLIDKPRDYPIMVLNSQNVLDASNQKGFDDIPNGFLTRYINEKDGYQYTEEYVMADGSAQQDLESLIETLELPYITDRAQAIKMAWYHLACRYLRPEMWNRKVSVEGYLISIGDMVEIQDDTIAVGIGEGGIIQSLAIDNNVITKIYTDGNFEVSDMTKVYGLKIMQADGVNPLKIRTIPINDILSPGLYSNFAVYIPLSDTVVPHEGDIIAFGIYDKITTNAICFGKKENGDGTFDLLFVPYQEGIYNTDTSKPIPPYNPNITTPQKLPPLHQIQPDPVTKNDVVEIARDISAIEIRELVYRLYPSANVIKIGRDRIANPSEISCEQFSLLANGYLKESNMILKFKTSESDIEYKYEEPIEIDSEWENITFLLFNGNMLLDMEIIPILKDANQAIKYELLPTCHVIKILANGMLEPAEISCTQQSKTAFNEISVSDKNMVYITSDNQYKEIQYTSAVAIDRSWEWIEFRLYEGEMLLDAERVNVLSERSIELSVELLEDSISILCDEDGNPKYGELPITSKAEFYVGTKLLNNDFEIFNTQIIFYPGPGADIFSPIPTGAYPVSINNSKDILKWELENAPEGIKIDRNGLIVIEEQVNFRDNIQIIVSCIINLRDLYFTRQIIPFPGNEANILNPIGKFPVSLPLFSEEKVLTIRKIFDEKSKIVVNIDNDHETFIFNAYGKVLENQLPFVTRTTLYRGTKEIKNSEIRWSLDFMNNIYANVLVNIIAINANGEITISQNLLMTGSMDIDVRAEYRGIVYSIIFSIKIIKMPDTGLHGIPRYLGKTYTVTNTNVVIISFTEIKQGEVAAVIGDYIAYVGPDEQGASSWKKNYCLQWTGNGWVQIDPANSENTDFYMRALRDIIDGAGLGAFSVILAQKIMALEVFADRLEAHLIKLRGPNGIIQSDNYSSVDKTGWLIDYMGNAFFNNATIANGLFFEGEIKTGPLMLLNDIPEAHEYVLWAGAAYNDIQSRCDNKPITGTYGSSAIIRMFTSITVNQTGDQYNGTTTYYYSAYGTMANGINVLLAQSWSSTTIKYTPTIFQDGNGNWVFIPNFTTSYASGNSQTLTQTIRFRYLTGGKTFKLLDLPTAPPEDMNVVWKDGTTLRIGH